MEDVHAAADVIDRALAEDLADVGDITSQATIPEDQPGIAQLVARVPGVLAGVALIAAVYARIDRRIVVDVRKRDGDTLDSTDVIADVRGPMRGMLTGERTALNLLTHLSGVATATRRFVDAIAGTECVIRDTRKTTPGMRLLEKAAVHAGGGINHRVGLFDGLLVKDNHVAAAGSITAATRAALNAADGRPVQIEVDTLAQLDEAIDAGARDILLDNFDPQLTRQAVTHVRDREREYGKIWLESSGSITLDTVRAYADAGVDRISVGAITHSAPQLDLALDVRLASDDVEK